MPFIKKKDLRKRFLRHIVSSRKPTTANSIIMIVVQKHGEELKDFVQMFNMKFSP